MLTYPRTESIETRFSIVTPSPLQKIEAAWTRFFIDDDDREKNVEVWCKRDDLLHGIIAGNKWRKLTKPLQDFQQIPASHILSFGGPYSNHLHALSYCCNQLNIKFTAVIRGAYLKDQALNRTLQDLNNWNANLVFVDKITYQKKTDQNYLAKLRKDMNADVIIPEGGSQQDALFGMQAMLNEINLANSSRPFDAILLPVGSGASMAGVIKNCPPKLAKNIIGIGVLQGEGYLEGLVDQFLNKDTPYLPWHINHQFHFGGYAKSTAELDTFCKEVNQQQAKQDTPICIEPVYSGKCFFALKTLIQQGYFAPHSKILIIHTGGLQGAR
ncbi:1-aminocyclopropane-1-carboxylate deaminase/D-cysteine desulfhydrase [Brumicola pallidula]|uniref:1-aminocyclopropane-1-carboxylate deaminase n=1 Tax=Brumicola pallidula DSM 14239 = ACAM 615 TaxID=1121922 RepID=K7A3M5_9ALTE|nr:pyridoxal-phosphate dependent enzyme [Glaciecola pallidula]GAC30100.1 1-aminocyclopropane-1-carboxylate deaminase [Glaciecola pallidula DSM 14239 = ACAM 615]